MRRIKRLICAVLAALMILGGALAEDGADETALQAQEQVEKEAAEKAAAKKAAAEKAAAEKAAAEKAAAEKAAAEKAAAEKAAAEKAAAEKEAAEKAAAEKAAKESSVTEGNDAEQKSNSTDDSTDKPSDVPSKSPSGDDVDKSTDSSKDTAKDAPSNNPTDAPSDDPTDTPSDDPADTPSDDPTDAPSDDPTDTPSDDPADTPSDDPADTPSDDPTDAPSDDPTDPPTETPTPAPTQVSGEIALSAAPSEGLTLDKGAYQVSPKQAATLTLTWSCSCACDGYTLSLMRDKDVVYSGQQSDAHYVLDLASLRSGNYVFTVEATLDGEVVAQGQYAFAVALADGGKKGGKGGFGGGGHGGGGKSGSRSGGSGGAAEEAQGFVITPGTALTSTHTSGTKDMQLYGTLALALSEDAMTALTLDDTALDITLNDGADGFTAYLEDSTLSLSPVNNGGIWRLNGRALRLLSDSGILSLSLETGVGTIVFPTEIALSGEVYARLRAAGYVSSDFEYRVSADGITVSVAGMVYRLEASGELTPLEGE